MLKARLNIILIPFVLIIYSCSNKDDKNTNASNYKITVTLNNVNAIDDFVSIVAVGANFSGKNTYPMWKVNGQNQPQTQTVSLGDTDFTGVTTIYVIETINPLDLVELGVQIINYEQDLTGNLKVESKDKTLINEAINLVGDNSDFTKDYSFDN